MTQKKNKLKIIGYKRTTAERHLEHPVGVGVTVPGQEAHITLVGDAKLALGELKISVPGYSLLFSITYNSIL